MQYIKVFKDSFKRTWLLLELSGTDTDDAYGMLDTQHKAIGYATGQKSIVDVHKNIWNFADDIVRFED